MLVILLVIFLNQVQSVNSLNFELDNLAVDKSDWIVYMNKTCRNCTVRVSYIARSDLFFMRIFYLNRL